MAGINSIISHKINEDDLEAGDHIYSWRKAHIYAHHGIYVGEGKVIHFTRVGGRETGTGTFLDSFLVRSQKNPCPNCRGGPSDRVDDGVRSSCVDCFLHGGKLYRFEYAVTPTYFVCKTRGGTCTIAPSDPAEEVLHRARYLLRNGCFGSYSLFTKNCEDFAIYCKTGLLVATRKLFKNPCWGIGGQAACAISVAVGFGMGAVSMYYLHRLLSDIAVRGDLSKVPVEELGSLKAETAATTEVVN